ncbi:amastin [Trypanosoma rangeli]|uniref:Amastin n=1 Tax=Trypanosoma rangeli TaxID=5698 RepID=A0A3R7ND49_TRYRA|nr:amastin [Trypanosoma rangeli]RNF04654.1 amastin [Trypanosoma rangeli]|eukprot:RNF04654.1 amastin [Trypanosoma rangeli]
MPRHKVLASPKDIFVVCPTLVRYLRAAEAFVIISILVLLTAVIFGLVTCCCCEHPEVFATMWSVLGIVTVMVVWVLMAHAYNQLVGGCLTTPFKHTQKHGGRVALLVTGWCILFVVIVFFNVL